MPAEYNEKLKVFCPRCFADEDGGSWGDGVHGRPPEQTLCANCGAMNCGLLIPEWAIKSIREQASWVGKRYYPHAEDYEKSRELRYLRSIVSPPAGPMEAQESEELPNFWTCRYAGELNAVCFSAPSETAARIEAVRSLPYPVPAEFEPRG